MFGYLGTGIISLGRLNGNVNGSIIPKAFETFSSERRGFYFISSAAGTVSYYRIEIYTDTTYLNGIAQTTSTANEVIVNLTAHRTRTANAEIGRYRITSNRNSLLRNYSAANFPSGTIVILKPITELGSSTITRITQVSP